MKDNFIITSDSVNIENGMAIVDFKGLCDFLIWEIDEMLMTAGGLEDIDIASAYQMKADLKAKTITTERVIEELELFGYNIESEEK